MAQYHVFDYEGISDYDFEKLPKGTMFEVCMNPYRGYVFLRFEKHDASTVISYDVLKEVMQACAILEGRGSDDPLRDYVQLAESGELSDVLADAARANIAVIEGGKNTKALVNASKRESKAV